MRTGLSEGGKSALVIFAPLLIVVAGLAWLTISMLQGISGSVDKQEHARAWQAVQSAFAAEERRIGSLMVDNAHWGEAVQNSYVPMNEEWVRSMWGITTADVNYDVMMIVQRDGRTIASYIHGEKVDVTAADYIGKDRLSKLLAEMPEDNLTFQYITSLINTSDSPMVMAAGTIVPLEDEDIPVPTLKSNVLILGQHVTYTHLGFMGQQFIVDKLSFTSLGNPEEGIGVLRDRWGTPVWRVTWKDRHPGETASREHRSSALLLILGLMAVVVPISAKHFRSSRQMSRNRQEAFHSARHDGLTGLANRRFMTEKLDELTSRSQANEVTLMYIDLDGFKNVNDAYGHEIGDLLLRMVAAGLQELAGEHKVIRLGGDEFAVLVTGADCSNNAEQLARSIIEFVRDPFDIKGRNAAIGASIGLAKGETGIESIELMRRSDIAMYDAKESGRGSWRWFNCSLDEKRSNDLSIAAELRELLSRGQLEIAYQPIFDATSRSIKGVEALARWPKTSDRSLTPAEFIPIAEEHGLISQLGQQVVHKACRDLAKWKDIRLAINVSPTQLNDKDFLQSLLKVATAENFDVARLEVEFTESC